MNGWWGETSLVRVVKRGEQTSRMNTFQPQNGSEIKQQSSQQTIYNLLAETNFTISI